VEGKGKITIGAGSTLGKWVNLGCGEKATLSFGRDCRLDKEVLIKVGNMARVKFGDHVSIENNCIIFSSSDWEIGNEVTFASGSSIHARERGEHGLFKVGSGSYIGNNTIIDLSTDISIGKEVAIGPNCVIYTHDHDYRNRQNVPWKGALLKGPVVIMDGAWIASNVTILPGISIGKNAVVAAGAVVTRSVPDGTLVGGIPAKIIKNDWTQ
jgi:acetyltransferase-like isoleucine patch superfamily enzyme